MTARIFVVVLLLVSANAQGVANPRFPGYGYQVIKPSPSPAVVGSNTHVDVDVSNNGLQDAQGVHVALSFNDWGISFNGWQLMGTEVISDLSQGGQETVGFDYTFQSAAHTCLEAKITQVDGGGNGNVHDDRAQINLEVIMCHGGGDQPKQTFDIPLRNDGDEPVDVLPPVMICLPMRNESEDLHAVLDELDVDVRTFPEALPNLAREDRFQCPPGLHMRLPPEFHDDNLDTLAPRPLIMEPHSAVQIELVALSLRSVEPVHVVVVAGSLRQREINHVLVKLVPTTVEELLNFPHLCCIRSVKLRVMLERMLAEALEAYQMGNIRLALRLLRLFMQKAHLLKCELTAEELACLEKALRQLLDAARMMAQEQHPCKTVMRAADDLRLQGLGEAAVLEYSKSLLDIFRDKCCSADEKPLCAHGVECCSDGSWACNRKLELLDGTVEIVGMCGEIGTPCPDPDICCPWEEEPGKHGNPWCFEGHTCCADAQWHCNHHDMSPNCPGDALGGGPCPRWPWIAVAKAELIDKPYTFP